MRIGQKNKTKSFKEGVHLTFVFFDPLNKFFTYSVCYAPLWTLLDFVYVLGV